MALLKPFDVMDGGGSAGFDAAVIAIDAVVLADGGGLGMAVISLDFSATLTCPSTSL